MAWDFSGSGQYFNFGDPTTFDSLSTMTISSWAQMDTVTADGGIIGKLEPGATNGFLLFMDDVGADTGRTDCWSWYIHDSPAVKIEGATGSATTGSWQHICGTFQGSSSTGLRLYINGSEDANSPADASSVADTTSNAVDLYVGNSPDATRDIDGKLAEIAVWNRVINANELSLLASGYSALFFRSGLLFYTRMISVDPIRDIQGGLTSTKVGTPSVFAHPPIVYPHNFYPIGMANRMKASIQFGE